MNKNRSITRFAAARRLLAVSFFLSPLSFCLGAAPAAEEKPPIKWSAPDTGGKVLSIPVADKATVLLFVRAGQTQSEQALQQAKATLPENGAVQTIVILSGPQAAEQAKTLAQGGQYAWPVVVDAGYAASGQMGVHVWPTTLVVRADGKEVAHLAGMPKSFASDLAAHVEFAAGRINEATLKQRLEHHDVVMDGPKQMAARHLQMAQRLLDQGRAAPALAEADEAIKLQPQDAMLQLVRAKALLMLNQPKQALEALDRVPAGAVLPWQIALLRGRALVALGQWEQAKTVLPDALKLNPKPAEAHYLLGLVYQHEKDFAKATESFRAAFEAGLPSLKMASPEP